ncbi:MAG TPA: TlpA disulfide reductase family protein, partial [Candidatus Binatia bacterium]
MENSTTVVSDSNPRPVPWRRLIITFAIIAPILALLAYGFQRNAHYINTPLIAKQAAPFTLTLFDGKRVTLADLRGKAIFLNFWASWCEPCRAEAKDLEAAWQRLKDKNMVFLGVALQDSDENSRGFVQEFGLTYPNGRDDSGKIAVDYGVWGIPETFFIDPQGR